MERIFASFGNAKPFITQTELFISTCELDHPALHALDDTAKFIKNHLYYSRVSATVQAKVDEFMGLCDQLEQARAVGLC